MRYIVYAFTSSDSAVRSTPPVRMTVKLLPRSTSINPDDNVGKGMDLALVTLLFLGIGWGLDRWLDTKPVFMIVLTVLALVGKVTAMYYGYEARMRGLDSERAEQRHTAPRSTYALPADEDTSAGITPEQFS